LVEYALEIGEVPTTAVECLAKDILMYRKVCTICNRMLPGDAKHFASHPKTRDGFQTYCRDCGSNQHRKYKKETPKKESKGKSLDYVEPVGDLDYFEDLKELDYRERKYA
jgi:hypothetical protein